MSRCRSCQAPIWWGKSRETGKPAPIDDQASSDGNLRLHFEDETYEVLSGERLEQARTQGEKLHLSHFVTCPFAKSFRRS